MKEKYFLFQPFTDLGSNVCLFTFGHEKNYVVMYALIFFDLSETIVGSYQPHSQRAQTRTSWSLKHWTTSFHGFCNILMNICLVFKISNGLAAPPLPLHFISFCPWESLQSTRISSTKDRTVAFCHSAFGRSALSAKAWTQWKLKSCLIPLGTAALSPALLKYLLKDSDL